ncbi:hypothetical protein A2635_04095 [Candidatus Peribacteria bacterium RIFCSPHIGHO2_01_FULL_51_9]|nr:MAG: hypothetical protein A2635_04095 [Candidatus Peribacteria bacterium RIFCSPHIGHO2_01_FULL_51_9]
MDHALVKDILTRLLDALQFDHTDITVGQEEDMLRVEISAPRPSQIIGWHGETLNAIQHLAKSILREKEHLDRAPFILLDVDGYRKIQEDKVRQAAERKADFVRRTGSRIALAPMSPYFRRLVHMHVANTPALQDLTTESIGEGDYRQIVLRLKEEKQKRGHEEADGELAPVITEDDGLENLDV